MGSTSVNASARRTFRQRLDAARRECFVGRAAERELVRAALTSAEPPFVMLHVHGPGGVGKPALLRRFADVASETGADCFAMDGRDIASTPADLAPAPSR